MKRILLLAAALESCLMCWSIPAQKVTRLVKDCNGHDVELRLAGDETIHCWVTPEDLPVLKKADGTYCYAEFNNNGFAPTSTLLGNPERSNLIKYSDIPLKYEYPLENITRPMRAPQQSVPTTGDLRGLVILVNYTDEKFTYTREDFERVMNEPGYKDWYFQGSVNDYFKEQSNGKLNLTFDVVGPVELPREMSYYGGNYDSGLDMRVGEMVAEACRRISGEVNFADYDWNGDGEVDQVVVLYAGWGEAMGASENTIWPQEFNLESSDYGRAIRLDGVKINTYAVTCELYGNEKAYDGERWITGIGPFCHEFSHCLGLPDFYDVFDEYHFTMCDWDIMDSGCYNYGTYCPVGYTGYEKWFCGWQDPIVLDEPCNVAGMRALSEGGDFYIVYNDQYSGKNNEYYILENRQWSGFDSWVYGRGLLVTHVNFNESAWRNNRVNTERGKGRMAIIPANNRYTYRDSLETGNTYPYELNDALTDTSTPSASVFNPNKNMRKMMEKSITDIVMNPDHTISFTFMGGNLGVESLPSVPSADKSLFFDLNGMPVAPQDNSHRKIIIHNNKKILR